MPAIVLGEYDEWRATGFLHNGGLTLVTGIILSEKSAHIIDIL